MKLLIDKNISYRILPLLDQKFHTVHHVKQLGLINAIDHEIFMFARQNKYDAVLTIDDDFVLLLNLFGSPPKIIWIRTGNTSTNALAEILIDKFQSIERFINNDEFALYEVFKPA
jgi:predicted nuclease of predicted toxin-antitoxin system